MFVDSEEFKIIKTITIPGEALSKKRAIQPVKFGEHLSIGTTKQWKAYEAASLAALSKVTPLPSNTIYPVYIHIFHYRKTKRMFDYLNMSQGAHDLLQGGTKIKHKEFRHVIVPEDNVNHVIPVHDSPFAGWAVDKVSPRTVITITSDPYYLEPEHLTKEGIIKLIENMKESGKNEN